MASVQRSAPRMVSVLTENWTMTDPRDLRGIVRMAQEAEDAGFDMVMVSDHVLLGPSAGDQGRMANPRDYAMPGNQDPSFYFKNPKIPWIAFFTAYLLCYPFGSLTC